MVRRDVDVAGITIPVGLEWPRRPVGVTVDGDVVPG